MYMTAGPIVPLFSERCQGIKNCIHYSSVNQLIFWSTGNIGHELFARTFWLLRKRFMKYVSIVPTNRDLKCCTTMEERGKSAKQIFTDWAQESSIAGIEFNSKCWLEFCLCSGKRFHSVTLGQKRYFHTVSALPLLEITTQSQRYFWSKTQVNIFPTCNCIPGLNNAAKAKSRMRMLVWALIFAIFSFMSVSNLASFVADFQSHPVTTSINVTKRSQIEFPAVTICNLNRSNANLKLYSLYSSSPNILIFQDPLLEHYESLFQLERENEASSHAILEQWPRVQQNKKE